MDLYSASTQPSAPSASMSPELMAKFFGKPEPLPSHINPELLQYGTVATYSPLLTAASQALFQHAFVIALVFALRGFNLKRVWDLHYLSVVFTFSIIITPFIFLYDTKLDRLKLLFAQEHEAVEALIFIRVVAPKLVAKHPGFIMLVLYSCLGILAIFVAVNDWFKYAIDLALWTAVVSDTAMATVGIILARRWIRGRGATSTMPRLARRKFQAESVWSIALILHGLTTASILAPVWVAVAYYDHDPRMFGYVWAAIWSCSFFVIAFGLPTAALFFSNIWCCCGSRKKVSAGEVDWCGDADGDSYGTRMVTEWPLCGRGIISGQIDKLPIEDVICYEVDRKFKRRSDVI